MNKILITGAAGFVGRRFVKYFLDKGDEVHAVDSLVELTGAIDPNCSWPLYNPNDYRNFIFYKSDCRDYFLLNKDTDFDYVFHLAAMVGGREMIEKNPIAVADDLSIDAQYWQWAKHCRPKKTVCFSSSASYPIKYQQQDNYCLLTEDMINFSEDIGMPDMSYGWAKLTCEYIAKLAYDKHGLNSVIYRPFSGYGEDQHDSYPFPSICKRVLELIGKPSVRVWGTGTQMRDFIHIDDCVDGVIGTMDRIHNAQAINLSTGIFTSFIDFAKLTAKLVGYSPDVVGVESLPTGVFARAGDTTFQEKLGFKAKIKLEDGILRALNYHSRIS